MLQTQQKRAIGAVFDNDSILIMRRISDGKEYFILPGGSVEVGESEQEAMIREIQEEVSLTVLDSVESFRIVDWGKEHVFFKVITFTGQMELGGEEKARMNDNDQYLPTWYTKEEFRNLNPFYPEIAKEKIFELF